MDKQIKVNKRNFILLIFLSVSIFSGSVMAQYASCQDELIPKYDEKKRMWGFSNLIGHWVIMPFYTKVSPFIEKRAVVQKGKLFGVIDCEGNVILPPDYQQISNYHNQKAWIKSNDLWGLANDRGKILIPPSYHEVQPIDHSEFAWLKKNGKWGLLNVDRGQMLCQPQFEIAKPLSANASMVQNSSGMFGVVNHVSCNYIVQPEISHVKKVNQSLVLYEIKGKWGMLTYDGRIKANPEYDTIYTASPFLYVIKKNQKFGIINNEGKVIADPEYDEIGEYSEGLFPFRKGIKYGYLNLLGKVFIKAEYDEANPYYNKQAIVRKNWTYGIINLHNEEIVPLQYASLQKFMNWPLYLVSQKEKNGRFEYLLNLEGDKISPGFQKIFFDSSSIIRVKIENQIKFWDIYKKDFIGQTYSDAKPFKNQFAFVNENHLWGVIDKYGKSVVSPEYEEIEYFWFSNQMVFLTLRNQKFGIVDIEGNKIFQNQFDQIVAAGVGYLKVKNDGGYQIYRTSGSPVSDIAYDYLSNNNNSPNIPDWPAIISQNEKYGLVKSNGDYLLKPDFKYIFYVGEGMYAAKEKKGYIFLNRRGQKLDIKRYDTVGVYSYDRIPASDGKKWGYLDRQGKEVVKLSYEYCSPFIGYFAIVRKNGYYGVINPVGETIIEPKFSNWKFINGEIFLKNPDEWVPLNKLL